jgi:hypothetical protein
MKKGKPSEDYARFTNALQKILRVSHSELQEKIQREKEEKIKTSIRSSSSSPASGDR